MTLSPLSKWRYAFSYRGKSCHIFKRADSKTAPYYIKIQRGKREFKQSLETPIQSVAVKRAKGFIDDIDGEKWEDIERRKVRHRVSLLEDVLALYRKFHGIKSRSARNNELSMLIIIRKCSGHENINPNRVSLSYIDRSLAVRFQDITAAEYCKAAARDDAAQTLALLRAYRSSRSTLCQARSIFTRKEENDLIQRYEDAGLVIPDCVHEFMRVRLRGSRAKDDYNPPDDIVIKRTFWQVEKLKKQNRDIYLAFWLAAGAALRRREIHHCRWEHFSERNGKLWLSGGVGKDGKLIQIRVQSKAAAKIRALMPDRLHRTGFVIKERSRWDKKLSRWMREQGWKTDKTMHELRAYVGSLIYRKNPGAAKVFMRHKTIAVTEKHYLRYGEEKWLDVL